MKQLRVIRYMGAGLLNVTALTVFVIWVVATIILTIDSGQDIVVLAPGGNVVLALFVAAFIAGYLGFIELLLRRVPSPADEKWLTRVQWAIGTLLGFWVVGLRNRVIIGGYAVGVTSLLVLLTAYALTNRVVFFLLAVGPLGLLTCIALITQMDAGKDQLAPNDD